MDDFFSLSSRLPRKNFLSPVDIHPELVSQFNTILNKTTAFISAKSNVISLLPFALEITERWPFHIQQHLMYYSSLKKIKKSRRQKVKYLVQDHTHSVRNLMASLRWHLEKEGSRGKFFSEICLNNTMPISWKYDYPHCLLILLELCI